MQLKCFELKTRTKLIMLELKVFLPYPKWRHSTSKVDSVADRRLSNYQVSKNIKKVFRK